MAKNIDVEYEYSLAKSRKYAKWIYRRLRGTGTIILYLPELWELTQEWYDENKKGWDEFSAFVSFLTYYEISERICLEKTVQKEKMNRRQCSPDCCVEYPTVLMMYPDDWDELRAAYH